MTKKQIQILIGVLIATGIIAAVLNFRPAPVSKFQTVDSGHREIMGTFARVVIVAVEVAVGGVGHSAHLLPSDWGAS